MVANRQKMDFMSFTRFGRSVDYRWPGADVVEIAVTLSQQELPDRVPAQYLLLD